MPRQRRTSNLIRKRKFVEPERAPEPNLDDLVDEGLILALAGVRLTVKNLIIVRALRDGADYDEEWYIAAVEHEFQAMAAEKREDARRVHEYLDAARTRPGHAAHAADYRSEDANTLERRAAVLTGLADVLDAAGRDRDAAEELVAAARETALDEIADAVHQTDQAARFALPNDDLTPAESARNRQRRLEGLLQDLALLELRDL